jgi:hypothetical protein
VHLQVKVPWRERERERDMSRKRERVGEKGIDW